MIILTEDAPSHYLHENSDPSKACSLEFANSAFSLKQCKFGHLDTLTSPRMVPRIFVISFKGISSEVYKL